MVLTTRLIICLTEVSLLPPLPLKYLEPAMLAAFCDQNLGNSKPLASTRVPCGPDNLIARFSHLTLSKGWMLAREKYLRTSEIFLGAPTRTVLNGNLFSARLTFFIGRRRLGLFVISLARRGQF